MGLSVIYSKTAKGLRARNTMIGGMSSHVMKVLSLIDGKSKAESILDKYVQLTEQELVSALIQLENEGYIRPVTVTDYADDWAPTTNFAPMIVEEFESEEEIEANARAKAEEEAKQEAERIAREVAAAEQIRAETKAREKARAEAKVKARMEAERVARETEEAHKKDEAEARAKAKEEARLEAEQKAKVEEETRLQAERKAQREAEQLQAKAEAEAKENARREIERIARDAEETQKKSEAEARAKTEAARLEAERKAKTEEDARLEAERKKQEKAEQARAKSEAARLEAERIAREQAEQLIKTEAEEKAKIEAKENSRREMKQILRKAEEDRKRTEAKAKEARLEAKRKAKAEEEVRLEAERKAQEKAEQARAKSEAARLEAERIAREQVDQLRIKAQAEEKARVDARENARREMERIGREAEEERKKSKADANAKSEKVQPETRTYVRIDEDVSFEAEEARKKFESETRDLSEEDRRELAEEEAQYEAERASKAEAEEVAVETEKKSRLEAESLAREEVKRIAREEAAANAKLKAEARNKAILLACVATTKSCIKWTMKVTLIGLPLLVLLLVGLLPFINLGMLAGPIEKVAKESIGDPVSIEAVHASLWPQPHFVLGNISIGSNSGLKIEAVNVLPETSTLFEEVKVVKSLEIEGLKIEQENFGQPLQWINNIGKAQHLRIEQINFKNVSLKIHDLELGPFEGKVGLGEARELKNIDLSSADHALAAQIFQQGGNFNIAITASNWQLPVNPKIVFDELNATGELNQNQINFSQIKGEIYGGNFTANALMSWGNQWSASGSFNLAKVSMPQMLKAFSSASSIDGKLNLEGNFSCKSTAAANLTEASDVTANFDISNGSLNGVELTRAVLSRGNQSLAGDATHFDKLSGSVQVKNGLYQYRKLILESPQFHAKGSVDILSNQDISGKITANLAAQSRHLNASFGLTGKVNDVKRQ
jgi:hypothetical protein